MASSHPEPRVSRSWTRMVYLYLVSLIGLLLITIGGIRLLDVALKALVFRQAEADERLGYIQPPMPYALERVERTQGIDSVAFTAEERATLRQWLEEYRRWETQRNAVDPIVARRQRAASSSIAMIVFGLLIYPYHWRRIRKDAEERRERTD